jgi:hypothetical protein
VVPGLTLYRVVVSGDDPLWGAAVVAGNEVIVDPAAERSALVKAWGYGTTRSAAAGDVAAALLLTYVEHEQPKLVADAAKLSYLGRLGVEGVSLPTETTEDGLPGLRFWYGTGANPATELIAVFKTDGTVELRSGRTHGGG